MAQIDNETAHTAPLTDDDIPDVNQAHYCFACNSTVTGLYCDSCGQKNDNFRRSVFSLLSETFGTIFGLESRIWQTWAKLLIRPGRVAREFANGARSKWSSPVRVYIAMSIILFTFLSWTGTQIVSLDININPEAQSAGQPQVNAGLKFFKTQRQIDASNDQKDMDIISAYLAENVALDFNFGGPASTESNANSLDISIGDKSSVGPQHTSEFIMSILRNPQTVNNVFLVWIPRLMFLMMPLTMLLGAVFIRGPNAILFDHLVHSAYIHAVTFMVVLISILAAKVIPGGMVAAAAFVLMLIYLPLSARGMFGRTWFKSILTSYCVGFVYAIVFIIVMASIFTIEISRTVEAIAA